VIAIDDFILFCNRTLDGMMTAIDGLTDDEINWLPPLPKPNSAFQLVVHATAAAGFWTDHIVLGNRTNRDRDAEFVSSGSTADARGAIESFRQLLNTLAPELAAATSLAVVPDGWSVEPHQRTVGAALIHVYEELAQHLGHLQITVDLGRND